jgi:hypothetical protein
MAAPIIPIPDAAQHLKVELTNAQIEALESIGRNHYEAYKDAYDRAGLKQKSAAVIAAYLLGDAIRRELAPARATARRGSKSPDGSARSVASYGSPKSA